MSKKVLHVSVLEGDVAGYDIQSFEIDGSIRYVEVKTTEGAPSTDFFISPNELAFSASHAKAYFLYRLFNFEVIRNSASSFVLHGDVAKSLQLTATAFRAKVIADQE